MRLSLLAGLAAAFLVVPAGAATTVEVASTGFSGASGPGAGGVVYRNTDGLPGSEEIRWGDATTSVNDLSGLRFSAAPLQTITQGTQFQLGLLTYFNNVISLGTDIEKVGFSIASGLVFDGAPAVAAGPFFYTIGIDETGNSGPISACPYASNLPCSDRISISTGAASQTFTFGAQTLTLYIDGFLDRNGVAQSNFIAQERESTTATLVGHFDVASDVPEPASWAMMVLGFGFLGGALRRSGKPSVA